jgi:hypothetical protein
MADEKKGGDPNQPRSSQNPLQEEKILSRLKSATGNLPAGVTSYTGLLGRSSRDGYWLLYTNLSMSRSVEIREEDIVHSEQLPPERSPFGSLGGTRVFVKKGAQVVSTRTSSRTHQAGDEFDLDIKLGGGRVAQPKLPCEGTESGTTCAAECGGEGTGDAQTCLTCVSCEGSCRATCFDTCRTQCDTCPGDTCKTCGQHTCNTCATHCGTCQTCQTQCQTCNTCATACGTCQTCQTCGTCQTQCNQATCDTCRTQCDTCPGDTCIACTHVTCFRTCGGIC